MTHALIFSEEEQQKIASLRREIHCRPELGNEEHRTTDLIVRYLSSLGLEILRPLPTGCVAVLRGETPGKTVALRADIDALPVTEATGADFASQTPGCMHACGHDVHTAALLGAATLLTKEKQTLPGAVKFIFQPDEEGDGGALRLLRSGALDDVSAFFGCHVDPTIPAGDVGIRYGKFYAAADTFDVTVRGRSAHGATPEKGIDALAAAAETVLALRALPKAFLPERAVLSVGTFHAGAVRNIISDAAVFTGIIRTLGEDTRATMGERFRKTVEETAASLGATAEITLRRGYPGVVNHDAETKLTEETAAALFGPARVHRLAEPTMTTEDFGFYLREKPGCFYHVGAGSPHPLHSPRFLPPEETLFTAARVHAAMAAAALRQYAR